MGASHFCNKQLYLDAKYLYGKPFREFIDFQRFSKLCDWNQNRYYKSLLTLLSIYTHYIIGMLPLAILYQVLMALTASACFPENCRSFVRLMMCIFLLI
uniref:Uncharacterized protein n=1 Tax=Microcystis aeruginosa (strain PCC 7806) TaxID=267872 RepID=A8YNZ6_MICA7|nr:unnamed protein product [Microcystis aeruginosa PCC 7806]